MNLSSQQSFSHKITRIHSILEKIKPELLNFSRKLDKEKKNERTKKNEVTVQILFNHLVTRV
jgi:hypothetical protein